jgi:hypothetical protein
MKIVKNQFTNEEVILDFHVYEGCTFTKCRFVVLGYGPFALNQSEVTECEFTFAGPAASTITCSDALNPCACLIVLMVQRRGSK